MAQTQVDASTSDDGGDGPEVIRFLWEQVSGPEGLEIASPESEISDLLFSAEGEYVVRLTVSDGLEIDRAEVTITVTDPRPLLRRGDSNTDAAFDISDGVFILLYLFVGGTPPDCEDAADIDDNGRIELTDAVFGFNYLFVNGDRPPEPGPSECGFDPTDDALGCMTPSCL
ncbi:MAG: hypothetical protein AAF517_18005 [Planctomycetota bacterium]